MLFHNHYSATTLAAPDIHDVKCACKTRMSLQSDCDSKGMCAWHCPCEAQCKRTSNSRNGSLNTTQMILMFFQAETLSLEDRLQDCFHLLR